MKINPQEWQIQFNGGQQDSGTLMTHRFTHNNSLILFEYIFNSHSILILMIQKASRRILIMYSLEA